MPFMLFMSLEKLLIPVCFFSDYIGSFGGFSGDLYCHLFSEDTYLVYILTSIAPLAF